MVFNTILTLEDGKRTKQTFSCISENEIARLAVKRGLKVINIEIVGGDANNERNG